MKLKNDEARKKFLEEFRKWDVLTEVPELNLTVYQYTLPDESRILRFHYGEDQARYFPSRQGITSSTKCSPGRYIHVFKGQKVDTQSHSMTFLVNILKSFTEI